MFWCNLKHQTIKLLLRKLPRLQREHLRAGDVFNLAGEIPSSRHALDTATGHRHVFEGICGAEESGAGPIARKGRQFQATAACPRESQPHPAH